MSSYFAWDTTIEEGYRRLRIWDRSTGTLRPAESFQLWRCYVDATFRSDPPGLLALLVDLLCEDCEQRRIKWTQEFVSLRAACALELNR